MQRKDNKKDIIADLPAEIADIISQDFDAKTLASAFQVSKTWHTLFTDIDCWKHRVAVDFHISKKLLNHLADRQPNDPACFRQLYEKLSLSMRHQHTVRVHAEVSNLLCNPSKHALVIACCLDKVEYLLNYLCRDDYTSCLIFAVYAESHNVVENLINMRKEKAEECFSIACKAGNLRIIRYLLQYRCTFVRLPTAFLYDAAQSGNKQLVQFFLEESGIEFSFRPAALLDYAAHKGDQYLALINYISTYTQAHFSDDEMLNAVAETGNKNRFSELYLLRWDKGEAPKKNSKDGLVTSFFKYFKGKKKSLVEGRRTCIDELSCKVKIFASACKSGNLELIKYLLDANNKHRIDEIPAAAFVGAAASGNVDLLLYLINHPAFLLYDKRKFSRGLPPHLLESMLGEAINHRNIEFVRYLLDPKNKFYFIPTQNALDRAAEIGSVALVSYFLDPKNSFGLTPNDVTLACAERSDCPELIFYLLGGNNRFNIDINITPPFANDHGIFIKLHICVIITKMSESIKAPKHEFMKKIEKEMSCEEMKIILSSLDGCNTHYYIPPTYIIIYAAIYFQKGFNFYVKGNDDQLGSLLSKLHECTYFLLSFSLSPRLFDDHISSILSPANPCQLDNNQINKLKLMLLKLAEWAADFGFDKGEILLINDLVNRFNNEGQLIKKVGETEINSRACRF